MTASALLAGIDWSRPWYAPFAATGRPLAAALATGADLRDWLNAEAGPRDLRNDAGLPLRFIPQSGLPDRTAYEAHIFATGEVPTRDNLHDLFNALVWLAFPRTKRLLNRLQAEAIRRDGVSAERGGLRDAATLCDENAILFLSADPAMHDALRGFCWQALFVDQRTRWGADCGVMPFGHALLEKLASPYKSVTAHAWLLWVPPGEPDLDGHFAASLADAASHARLLGGRSFSPLPVMGIPGWCTGNEDPAYYADTTVFRPGRQRSR
jgi:hypothetical protein